MPSLGWRAELALLLGVHDALGIVSHADHCEVVHPEAAGWRILSAGLPKACAMRPSPYGGRKGRGKVTEKNAGLRTMAQKHHS